MEMWNFRDAKKKKKLFNIKRAPSYGINCKINMCGVVVSLAVINVLSQPAHNYFGQTNLLLSSTNANTTSQDKMILFVKQHRKRNNSAAEKYIFYMGKCVIKSPAFIYLSIWMQGT